MTSSDPPRRALVLGSGGLGGIAWQAGVLTGLAEQGASLSDPDRIIGTSGGAIVAAALAHGDDPGDVVRTLATTTRPGRVGLVVLARLLAAQVWPSRRHSVIWLGSHAERHPPLPEADWVRRFEAGFGGRPWPAQLTIVATNAATGRPAYFTARTGVDLPTALAATCAIPGVMPPVHVGGVPYFDGGLRSPANADVPVDCGIIVALAPLFRAFRRHRRTSRQIEVLNQRVRALALTPDPEARRAMGTDLLNPSALAPVMEQGRRQGRQHAPAVSECWAALRA